MEKSNLVNNVYNLIYCIYIYAVYMIQIFNNIIHYISNIINNKSYTWTVLSNNSIFYFFLFTISDFFYLLRGLKNKLYLIKYKYCIFKFLDFTQFAINYLWIHEYSNFYITFFFFLSDTLYFFFFCFNINDKRKCKIFTFFFIQYFIKIA